MVWAQPKRLELEWATVMSTAWAPFLAALSALGKQLGSLGANAEGGALAAQLVR